jgi:SOS-response transcriptional repressor LexA
MSIQVQPRLTGTVLFDFPTMAQRRRLNGNAVRTRIFDFIVAYKKEHDGNSPTSREIMDATYVSSTSVVHYHLYVLERDGKIIQNRRTSRSIEIVGGTWTFKEPVRHAAR